MGGPPKNYSGHPQSIVVSVTIATSQSFYKLFSVKSDQRIMAETKSLCPHSHAHIIGHAYHEYLICTPKNF